MTTSTKGSPLTGDGLKANEARAERKISELKAAGVKFIQSEFVDINGHVRGKICNLAKGLAASGSGVSSLVEAFTSADGIVMTPFSNSENSFPKMVSVPDFNTAAQWPWDPEMASVLCQLYMEDGTPTPIDPHHILRAACDRLTGQGLEMKGTLEYEFFLFNADDVLLREKRYRELKPFGRTWNPYSVTRAPSFTPIARDFISRMEALGIEIEMVHTEYGHGMYEYTHGLADPLKGAENAVRARLYMKQLAAEHGLVASYMPVIGAGDGSTSSGAHHNVSLWQDGRNLMWDPATGGLSPLGRQFAAGVLATMPDLHLLFRPWINSYRRMDRTSWNPENASWGLDNHTVAVRVVHGGVPPKHSRLEHRAPGADVNPYLSMAAIVLGGLYGIENKLEPPPYVAGDAVDNNGGAMLPNSLEASIDRFDKSPIARALFGDIFVDHLTAIKRGELEAFEASVAEKGSSPPGAGVTDWEREHYFEWA